MSFQRFFAQLEIDSPYLLLPSLETNFVFGTLLQVK